MSAASSGSRRSRCGQCQGCLAEDCGTCPNCADKKKFGGTGRQRKVCIHRRCIHLQYRGGVTDSGGNSGGPTTTGKKRKTLQVVEEQHQPSSTISYRVPTSMYGMSVGSEFVVGVCAGCHGLRDEELKDEPIVLCDGKGCCREYHLQCCLPPLTVEDVPDGAYLCTDCDPDGTSKILERYFDDAWESRAKFDTSRDYVKSLFHGSSSSGHGDDNDDRIPVSEFPRIATLHGDAIAAVRNLQPAAEPDDPLLPDFLIGKPLRLYCPDGNSCHSGRILDFRLASTTSSSPSSSLSSDKAVAAADDYQYGNLSIFSRCEFLVSFPAGLDYRKKTVTQWLILEEHSLAVGTTLVFAYDGRKKDWSPGITWLRTSLELKPILDRLSEADGQVLFDTRRIGHTESWALTQIFGREAHLLTILREETVDLFSPSFADRFSRKTDTVDGPRVDLAVVLAYTEVEEQRRIRQWYRLPLNDVLHEKALTLVDRYKLPPLQATVAEDSSSEQRQDELVVEVGPRPCPLILPGLDRTYVMHLLQSRGVEQSKDTAANLKMRPVKSRAAAVQRLQNQANTEIASNV